MNENGLVPPEFSGELESSGWPSHLAGRTAVFEFLQEAAAVGGPAAMGSFGQFDSLMSEGGYDEGGGEEVAAKVGQCC
jgi:hypothetical protein